jgi:DNA helicase TIP49 (TBP-interacting protein)
VRVKGKTYDVDTWQKIPRPAGTVLKEEFIYTPTLVDLDELNAKRRSGGGIFPMLFGGAESKEMDSEIRIAADQQVKEW